MALSPQIERSYTTADYQCYLRGGQYHAKPRIALGLKKYVNSDFEVLYNDYLVPQLGASGGVIGLAARTNFDCGDTLEPTSKILTVGAHRDTSVVRPAASPFAKPMFDLKECQGTGNRQEKTSIENLKIDLRGYAASSAIRHYNLKDSVFRNLWLNNFKAFGFYMEGFDAGSFNMWNHYKDIFYECSSATAFMELHGPNNMDSVIENVVGTSTGTIGIRMYGAGNWDVRHFHPNFASNSIYIRPNGDSLAGVCYSNRFYNVICDNNQADCIVINTQNGNIRNLLFDHPYFLLTANTFDLFSLTLTQQLRDMHIVHPKIHPTSPGSYEYVIDSSAVNHANCGIYGNTIPAGGTGIYNNWPYEMIFDDQVHVAHKYEVVAGPGWPAAPTWVGTPVNGLSKVIMRNTGAGQSRGWEYSNGAWIAAWTV